MADDAIPLHFSKAEATVPGSPLHRLACQHGHWASRPGMYLVVHHVLESLVICWVQEDLGFELTTGMTVVHHLPTSALIPNTAGTAGHHALSLQAMRADEAEVEATLHAA